MDQTADLIKQCLSGSKQAWDSFVNDYSRWIYHCILRTAHSYGRRISTDDTDELCQDVFVILLDRGLKQFKGQIKPCLLAYLRRIAVCHTINYLKKCNKYIGFEDCLFNDGQFNRLIKEMELPCPQDEQKRMDNIDQLQGLMEQLSADERRILQMCYFDQMSADEIAKTFFITVDTYYVRKNRALNKLRTRAIDQQMKPLDHKEKP